MSLKLDGSPESFAGLQANDDHLDKRLDHAVQLYKAMEADDRVTNPRQRFMASAGAGYADVISDVVQGLVNGNQEPADQLVSLIITMEWRLVADRMVNNVIHQ